MKNRPHILKALLVPVALAAATLPLGTSSVALTVDPEMKIEVTMKDKEYHVKGHTLPGALRRS